MENKIEAKNLDLYYGEKHALKNVSLDIKTNKIITRTNKETGKITKFVKSNHFHLFSKNLSCLFITSLLLSNK